MSLALAATWNPRGELDRFLNRLPQLMGVYEALEVVSPPHAPKDDLAKLQAAFDDGEKAGRKDRVFLSPSWPQGRYLSIKYALETNTTHIHYADVDRLLRWVEICPDEWSVCLDRIERSQVLIFGRTPVAYATHPNALVQTEALSNLVVSHILGQAIDVSAGSKAFSRDAAAYIIDHTLPVRAIGTDATWPIVLHRAGYPIDYLEVDGLDWESADRYQITAADQHAQKQAAERYDADPEHWAFRIGIAQEIIDCAFDALTDSISSQ